MKQWYFVPESQDVIPSEVEGSSDTDIEPAPNNEIALLSDEEETDDDTNNNGNGNENGNDPDNNGNDEGNGDELNNTPSPEPAPAPEAPATPIAAEGEWIQNENFGNDFYTRAENGAEEDFVDLFVDTIDGSTVYLTDESETISVTAADGTTENKQHHETDGVYVLTSDGTQTFTIDGQTVTTVKGQYTFDNLPTRYNARYVKGSVAAWVKSTWLVTRLKSKTVTATS